MPPDLGGGESADAAEWLRRARSSLIRCREDARLQGVCLEDLCFDAQQAASIPISVRHPASLRSERPVNKTETPGQQNRNPQHRVAEALDLRQTTELLLDFPQDAQRQGLQPANDAAIVDRAALIDHDLTILPVPRHASRQNYAEQVLPGKPGRAGQDPGRRMFRFVQKVGLDHEDRPDLSRLRSTARTQVRKVERSSPDDHDSFRPSAAR